MFLADTVDKSYKIPDLYTIVLIKYMENSMLNCEVPLDKVLNRYYDGKTL